jgi:energy-coupling factor transport system substrate-specific component
VTWQLASFAILAFGLTAGFAWYERSKPSARVLALVAALAALAVVGRLAFAAFPNVKPTTDIVLLAGYALGGAPGFAVGAITPVASNIFMGQGPWTPWQMAAWGGVGIFGAVLARITGGRELGRWPLALACAVAGIGFGAVMDTYQWTLAAEQDAATWIAVSGSSLPYNLAHVVGNVVFCLLIGPGLLRALSRYRRRFEVRWARAAAAAGAVLLLLAVPVGAGAASAGKRATAWLASAQNSDGGFGSARGQASGALFTGWASLGLAAGGRNPRDVARRGHSAIDFIRSEADDIREVGEVERTILVLEASGLSARSFAGRDFVARLERYRRANGSFSGFVSYTAFGILALRAAGSNATGEPARWLSGQQNSDGGFGLAPGAQSDIDNTAAAIQALAAAGQTGAIGDAVAYLRGAQNSDGGFGQYDGRSSNAQSTAYAVQGLVAAGRNPGRFRKSGRSPLAYLRSLQRSNGSVNYSRASSQTPVWVTAQAVMALKRKPFPIDPVPRDRVASATAGSDPAPAATAKPSDGAGPGEKKTNASRDVPAERIERELPAQTSDWTSYAPLEEVSDQPGPGATPDGGGPSWLGVALTLAAAGAAFWTGRRVRAANVATKSSATTA